MDRQIIFVGGKRFTIVTDESEAYMKKIVERVDTKLKSIISSNPKLDKKSYNDMFIYCRKIISNFSCSISVRDAISVDFLDTIR